MTRLAPFLACMLLAGTASADPAGGSDRTRAEKLFREGSEALEKGRTDEACTKLAESAALYRALGTEYNLGTCFEVSHRTASAKRAYLRAAAIAHQSGRENVAKDAYARARKMDAATPKLTVTVPTDAGTVTLLCDGIPIVAGDAIELDPGTHLVKATATGRAPFDARVELVEGRPLSLTATLAPASEASVATPASATPGRLAKDEPKAADTRGVDLATVVGLGLGAAGVVALGVGVGFAFEAKSGRDDAGCQDGRLCPDRAAADRLSAAKSDANVATALFVTGGVLAVAGAVLAIVDPFAWRAHDRKRRDGALRLAPAVAPGVAVLRLSMGW